MDAGRLGPANKDRGLLSGLFSSLRSGTKRAHRRTHFVFLIDSSGSMDTPDIMPSFGRVHGEFLDALAMDNPDAIVSVLTYDAEPYTVYLGKPISEAPVLDLGAEIRIETGIWEDLPKAIHLLLSDVVNRGEYAGYRPSIIIVTDGATEGLPLTEQYVADAQKDIRRMRNAGASILMLLAVDTRERRGDGTGEGLRRYAEQRASKVGILPSEVGFWGQPMGSSGPSLSSASNASSLGATGPASSVQPDETDFPIVLPPRYPGRPA